MWVDHRFSGLFSKIKEKEENYHKKVKNNLFIPREFLEVKKVKYPI